MADYLSSPLVAQRAERQFPTEPGWSSGMTLVFLLAGELDIQVNTHLYHMRPHDFLFFKPYDIHYATHPGQVYTAFVLTLERPLLTSTCPQLDSLRFDLRLLRQSADDPVYQAVCQDLAEVVYAAVKRDVCSELKTVTAVTRILSRLIEAYGSEGQDTRSAANYARTRSADILRYISEHYADRVTLQDIAGHVGLHPQYFSAFFKKNFNANFSDYLNRYRVGQSLRALLETDESILSIAVANGFNNHKTYSAAFQRAYGMLPREYRRAARAEPPREPEEASEFRFFQQYWDTDEASAPHVEAVKTHQTIQYPARDRAPFTSGMRNFISVGRALTCLRSDVQQQLRQAKEDLRLDYVRIRDIFSDDLYFYAEDANKAPVFNWVAVDAILDFFQSIGVRPYVELGYMPAPLASKKQYANWQYHPNVSAPKSYAGWALLVTRFLEHCVDRYGREEVRQWYFEFWTSANLKLAQSYWNESQEEFFRFYHVTYDAIRAVDPHIPFGTPNFSYPSGMSWYEAFFAYAQRHRLRPDFISHHAYCVGDGQDDPNVPLPTGGSDRDYRPLVPYKDYLLEQVNALTRIARHSGFGGLDIIISDWNVSHVPLDYTRDTAFMAAYICHVYASVLDRVKGLCVWSLSDIHEEFFYNNTLFHGGPGLLAYTGVPKASYHAVSFAFGLSRDILQAGPNYILARKDDGYQLLLFNLAFYDQTYRVPDLSALTYTQRYNVYESVRSLSFHLALAVPPGVYTLTHHRVSRESGSSYDLWLKMGRPDDPRGDLTDHLKARCTPDLYVETAAADPTLVFDALVEPHGVTLVTIQPLRKPSGDR